MTTYGLPLFLEDTTGHINGSNYIDIYDRRPYLHLAVTPTTPHPDRVTRQIFVLPSKPLQTRFRALQLPDPIVTMEFGANHALGTIAYAHARPKAMERYLEKESRGGSSLVRRFRASDGMEYTWSFRSVKHTEWTCTNSATKEVVGHYDLKPSTEPAYRTSGNSLTVTEKFQYLAVELLASLTIMRHIAEHNL